MIEIIGDILLALGVSFFLAWGAVLVFFIHNKAVDYNKCMYLSSFYLSLLTIIGVKIYEAFT